MYAWPKISSEHTTRKYVPKSLKQIFKQIEFPLRVLNYNVMEESQIISRRKYDESKYKLLVSRRIVITSGRLPHIWITGIWLVYTNKHLGTLSLIKTI